MARYSNELKEKCRVALVDNHMDYIEVAKTYNVPYSRLTKWAENEKWPTNSRIKKVVKAVGDQVTEEAAKTVVKSLIVQGQAHAERVFAKASEACRKSIVKAPVNWKDFEIADRVARRAAGMNDEQNIQQTLIHMGDLHDAIVEPVTTSLHAETVEVDQLPLECESLPSPPPQDQSEPDQVQAVGVS